MNSHHPPVSSLQFETVLNKNDYQNSSKAPAKRMRRDVGLGGFAQGAGPWLPITHNRFDELSYYMDSNDSSADELSPHLFPEPILQKQLSHPNNSG